MADRSQWQWRHYHETALKLGYTPADVNCKCGTCTGDPYAEQDGEASQDDESGSPRSEIREEDGHTANGGTGVRAGGSGQSTGESIH